ncbi:type VI secretion system protein TssA [Aureimonas pseudogalii]|uniref:Type VI secretion system protein ImpA n=1 Tax=Aureimonas pseudogalii TaxID=1744844 RepID=A0A7W6H878_9HYPH|nr:type VI secretion system protein TssA [Aureimonas pseudogalii]MBB4000434.1 type VI secretion system protein ImpA [Aureimonas pseudogalii]
MSLPSVIDLEALSQPVGEETSSGNDPRADGSAQSLYYRVKDARGSARAAERGNVDADAPPPETWGVVLQSGLALLSGQAKDLEVAAWTTEALVRLEGFLGLRDGLRMLTVLVDGFWDTIHPLPDEEDGNEGRLTAVAALSGAGAAGTLAQTLRTLPIVGIARPCSIWNYDQAMELEKLTDPERRAARIAGGAVSLEAFRDSLAETAGHDLHELLTTIEEALAALAALGTALDRVAGYDAPSFTPLRELLEHVAGSIRHFGADKLATQEKALQKLENAALPQVSSTAAAKDSGSGVSGDEASSPVRVSASVHRINGFANREEALDAVTQLAQYFRTTEPQAPISYTLTEAVRRARMSLPELLQELTTDASHISRFILAAGMRIEGKEEITLTQPVYSTSSPSSEDSYSASSSGSSDGW